MALPIWLPQAYGLIGNLCSATPLQVAMAHALRNYKKDYLQELKNEYCQRRDLLADGLAQAGFKTYLPKGTYFLLADFSTHSQRPDRIFAHQLAREARVATVPQCLLS